METRYFSRIRLRTDTPDLKALAQLAAANPYREHKLAWRFFADDPDACRDFLFRRDGHDYYVVSCRPPQAEDKLWQIDCKPYQPELAAGDLLQFSLRANPVIGTRRERSAADAARWEERRRAEGLKQRPDSRRLVRHDVVMAAKKRLEAQYGEPWWKNAEREELVHAAGSAWLEAQGQRLGFTPLEIVTGAYRREEFHDGAKRLATIARLDLSGTLRVTEPDKFLTALFNGIGPAKGFGCGLLLVRRMG